MHDFFNPWRRKIGVVTLVMACLFAAGWVRSLSYSDMSEFYSGRHRTELLCSFDCSLVWIRFYDNESHDPISLPDWDATPRTIYSYFDDSKFDWTWQLGGFGVGSVRGTKNVLWIIPYWSIVIPLTIVSAYLLLGKPRPAKKPELFLAADE